jgi:hypothetical protein
MKFESVSHSCFQGYYRAAKACLGQGNRNKAIEYVENGIKKCDNSNIEDLRALRQMLGEEFSRMYSHSSSDQWDLKLKAGPFVACLWLFIVKVTSKLHEFGVFKCLWFWLVADLLLANLSWKKSAVKECIFVYLCLSFQQEFQWRSQVFWVQDCYSQDREAVCSSEMW